MKATRAPAFAAACRQAGAGRAEKSSWRVTNVGALADESAPVKTICQVLHTLGVGGAEVLAARLAYQLGDTY